MVPAEQDALFDRDRAQPLEVVRPDDVPDHRFDGVPRHVVAEPDADPREDLDRVPALHRARVKALDAGEAGHPVGRDLVGHRGAFAASGAARCAAAMRAMPSATVTRAEKPSRCRARVMSL